MKKEFKIGMFVGLAVIIVAVIYFSTRKSSSVESVAVAPVAEPNILASDVNAPPQFDANSAMPLPGKPSADANVTAAPPTTHSSDSSTFEQSSPITTQRFHVVRKGDTLSSISQKYYGSTKKVDKIFEANRSILKSKNSLKIGMKLAIPE